MLPTAFSAGNASLTPASTLRRERRRVDGVLLLDKPTGITSNAALLRVRRVYNAEKAGHTGTLDPLASGLLPICLGEATKFARFLLDASKRYTATVRFGVTTTTQDAEGEVVATRPVEIEGDALVSALRKRIGRQDQIPPAHSALKLAGRPYYAYARAGIDIPRAPREIEIQSVELVSWRPPDAVIDILCSKGTYVRTFAADLGAGLGCGAHLLMLRRTSTGAFDVADAVPLATIETMDGDALMSRLLSIEALLAGIERLDLGENDAAALAHGQRPIASAQRGTYRVHGPNGRFVGLAEVVDGRLCPLRLVRPAVSETPGELVPRAQ
jgi:tRNA pseudouridine55 synthase